MRWRDIRFEKPTEADGDAVHSEVIVVCKEGKRWSRNWEDVFDDGDVIAWMPLSELPAFDPIPDPPEGWRFVEKGEAFDKRAKYWGLSNHWVETLQDDGYAKELVYIVPIDPPKPPKPQYRPFANAAEFEPYKNKWWRYKSMGDDEQVPPVLFNDKIHGTQYWDDAFTNKVFSDGSPFGVKVEP
jgi:hypothetical protein